MIARLSGIVSLMVSAAVIAVPGAEAQGWKPERNVELIIPASAGGSLDTSGRVVQKLWDELKLVPVSSTVVNRSGGGHAVAYNHLNQHAGDPHFMSITSSTLHTSNINGRTPHVASGKMRVLAVSSAKRLPGPLSAAPTWPELGYKGIFENWRGVIGTKGMTADQISFWENVFRKVVESDEFRKLAQKNQWDVNFKSATETRRFMEAQYSELKDVMTFLGLAK